MGAWKGWKYVEIDLKTNEQEGKGTRLKERSNQVTLSTLFGQWGVITGFGKNQSYRNNFGHFSSPHGRGRWSTVGFELVMVGRG